MAGSLRHRLKHPSSDSIWIHARASIIYARRISIKKLVPYRPPFFNALISCPLRILIDEVERGDRLVGVGEEQIHSK